MSQTIQDLRIIPYQARLKALNLHSQERRRLRGDLIEVFKRYRGNDNGDISKIHTINNQDITRNNEFKKEKFWFKRDIERTCFQIG